MSSHASPTSGWAELFEAVREFREARPWEHLTDRILFGVRLPGIGPILHCAVMGAGEEVFGLAVYPGAEGLRAYERSLAFLHTQLATPAEGLGMLQISGIELMEKTAMIPTTILVRSDKAVHLLEPVTGILQIELRRVESLEVVEDSVSELQQTLKLENPPGSEPGPEGEKALMLQMGKAYEDLLKLFEHWLIEQGFAGSTVQRHWESVEAFLFGFLMEQESMTPEEGLFQADDFFGQWLPTQGRWTSRQRIQAIVPGLKKFAAFLRDLGLLEEEDFQDFLTQVRDRKDDWISSALSRG